MWTETTRKKYARCGIRYASDMTDGEWRLIEPLLPSPRRLGRPRTTNLREVVNALLYIAETGCQWRMVGGCRTFRCITMVSGRSGSPPFSPLVK